MIILFTQDYNKTLMKEILKDINTMRPNWKYSVNHPEKEADVHIQAYEGEDIFDDIEELSDSTQDIVIGITEDDCVSESPYTYNGGLRLVTRHIKEHIEKFL
ncbi:hypothetical protein Biyabedamokiny2_00145 [Staphylococcus phage Biyabeda-mokiny_2]|nr:hypothetical protein Biyabedamokiny2_00145 [Staphylococcus phage Biyabeda-mokiny_2]